MRPVPAKVSARLQAQIAELLSHLAAAIDHYRTGETTPIPWIRRSAATTGPRQTLEVLLRPRRGTHAEFIAGLLDRMTAGAQAMDWCERQTH